MRDREAHFRRIGSFCPKQNRDIRNKWTRWTRKAGRPENQSCHDTCHKGESPKVKGR
ncbi:hypothetical protein KI387_010670, partial [Taxus chinensis]